MTIASFISTIGSITFPLSNGFLKSFLSKLKRKKSKQKNQILAKSALRRVKSIISKAIQEFKFLKKTMSLLIKKNIN